MVIRLMVWSAAIAACVAPGVAAADGLVIPGIGPEQANPRPSYRNTVFPPPQFNVLGMRERTPRPSDRPSYRETYNDFPPPGGRFGGGFLEYVLTGGRPEPVAQPVYAARPVYAAPVTYAAPAAYAAPAYGQPGPVAYSALAAGPARASMPKGGLPDYTPQPSADGASAPAVEQGLAIPGLPDLASLIPSGSAQPGYGQLAYSQPAGDLAPGGGGYAPAPARAMNPIYDRQVVAYSGRERAGTVIIDTPDKFLYLVEGNGRALRYGIGVGRPGFTWAGVKSITRKAEWPSWTPPSQMLKRRPDLPRHMVGGEGNPLGARAMYLGSSLYRIHGTNEPNTIGTNVSSGCIRMMNQDVIDLYGRVGVGTRVVIL